MAPNNANSIDHPNTAIKHAVPSRGMNVRMLQNVRLIWLDNNINENDADCRNTLTQLCRVVDPIQKYTDDDQCLQFLKTMENEKACMIISGSLGQDIVPRIHQMAQVDSIFIFCSNKKPHEQWAKKWSKIKGVFIEITPICQALKKVAQQCEQDAMSISFMATSGIDKDKDLRLLTDCIRQETFPTDRERHRLVSVLLKMVQSAEAQEVHEILPEQTTDEYEERRIYDELRTTDTNRGYYQEAIRFFEKSPSSTNLTLATSYNHIKSIYKEIGDSEKALAIRQQSLPPNQPH